MQVKSLFDREKKKEIRQGLKAGRVIPSRRPAMPDPAEEPTTVLVVPPPNPAPAVAVPAPQARLQPPPIPVQPPPIIHQPAPAQQLPPPKYPKLDMELLDAVTKGDEGAVASLLKQGANPNACFGKRTLVHLASETGHAGIISLLQKAGANMNQQDEDGKTPLHYAVGCKQPASLKTLIRLRAKLDLRDKEGRTALHSAVLRGDEYSASLLVDAGADCTIRMSKNDMSPLMSAIFEDSLNRGTSLTKAVLSGNRDLEAEDSGGKNALFHAIDTKQGGLVRMLLKAGASPNSLGPGGESALQYARENGTFWIAAMVWWRGG